MTGLDLLLLKPHQFTDIIRGGILQICGEGLMRLLSIGDVKMPVIKISTTCKHVLQFFDL